MASPLTPLPLILPPECSSFPLASSLFLWPLKPSSASPAPPPWGLAGLPACSQNKWPCPCFSPSSGPRGTVGTLLLQTLRAPSDTLTCFSAHFQPCPVVRQCLAYTKFPTCLVKLHSCSPEVKEPDLAMNLVSQDHGMSYR